MAQLRAFCIEVLHKLLGKADKTGEEVECRLTHRQKFIKADLIVIVAVQFLEDLSDPVPRQGVAGLFEKLGEFIIGDKPVAVEICGNRRRGGESPDTLSN